jgi:hypothetical protein
MKNNLSMESFSNTKIEPGKVQTPIQLIAVWFATLVIIDGLFLIAAINMQEPIWIRPMLTITAAIFVIIFLIAALVMQIKFRTQIQEDKYYSEWLERNETKLDFVKKQVDKAFNEIPHPHELENEDYRKSIEKFNGSLQAIDEILSLTSTQAKILEILSTKSQTYHDISHMLYELYGSETRTSVIQKAINDLVNQTLIKQVGDKFELSSKSFRLLLK